MMGGDNIVKGCINSDVLNNDDKDKSSADAAIDDDFFADLDFPIFSQSPSNHVYVQVEDVLQNNQFQVQSEDDDLFLDVDQLFQDDDENREVYACEDASSKTQTVNTEEEKDQDDPITKKRQRQMRNRDAAVRSRERKKMYVKDLEVKSKYLELECIRLQRLLQACAAQNHALHLQLQDKAFTASRTKQESAVLLLESLLLGSLLWFLVVLGLFSPLILHQLPAGMLVNVGRNDQKAVDLVALGRARSKMIGLGTLRLLFKSKRCKGSRSRMKAVNCYGVVA